MAVVSDKSPGSKDSFRAVPSQEVCSPSASPKTDSPLQTCLLVPKKNGARAALQTVAAGEWGMLGLTNCFGNASKTALSVPAPVILFRQLQIVS